MRIAFDDQTFTQQTYGGISRYFCRLVGSLLGEGHEPRIFAPLHINSYIESLPPGAVVGKRMDHYPYRTARLFTGLNHFLARRSIAAWRPQVIHETYYSKVGSGCHGCPVVVTVYDMIHELFPGEFSNRVDTRGAKRAAVKRADHVICISERTKRDLMQILDVPEQKITVIHLACDPSSVRLQPPASNDRAIKPYLLFVGARGGYKNFHRVLQVMSASPRLKAEFDLIAFGGGHFSGAEMALIQSMGFSPGQVQQRNGDDSALERLYAQASAFVYPSIYEGFGIPPLEAMAHGCPVVSSNASSMPEVIGDAGAYFNPLDVDEMRSAIESVVLDASRAEAFKAAGDRRVAQFSWARCAHETAAVYRALV